MKAIPVTILAVVILVAGFVTYRPAAKPQLIVQAEACTGLDCWPSKTPMKYAPVRRDTRPPVW
jgi:hypothetical protein